MPAYTLLSFLDLFLYLFMKWRHQSAGCSRRDLDYEGDVGDFEEQTQCVSNTRVEQKTVQKNSGTKNICGIQKQITCTQKLPHCFIPFRFWKCRCTMRGKWLLAQRIVILSNQAIGSSMTQLRSLSNSCTAYALRYIHWRSVHTMSHTSKCSFITILIGTPHSVHTPVYKNTVPNKALIGPI